MQILLYGKHLKSKQKNDLTRVKLEETVNLQDIIKTDNPHYKPKSRKVINFSEYSLPTVFLRDIIKRC